MWKKKLPHLCGRSEEKFAFVNCNLTGQKADMAIAFLAQVNNRPLPGKYLSGAEKSKKFLPLL